MDGPHCSQSKKETILLLMTIIPSLILTVLNYSWICNDLNLSLSLLKHKKIKAILSDLMIVKERPHHNFTMW